MFENLTNNCSEDPKNHVSQFTETLLDCAEKSGFKACKKRGGRKRNDALWFDAECRSLKNKLMALAKKLKQYPQNNNLREVLYGEKRKLHRLIKKKKRAHKTSLIEQMHLTNKKDTKAFWKLLDKLSPGTRKSAPKGNIKIGEWVSHFKDLFHSGKTKNFL